MAFKRKMGSMRPSWARKWTAKKPVKRRRVAKFAARRRVSLDNHSFTRYSSAVSISTSATEENLTYSFSLSDVLSYTEFTSLFDQYKITMVEFKIQMISNPNSTMDMNNISGSYNTVNWYPKFWYIRDYDGGGSESLSAIKERVGVKFFVMRPNKEYTIKIRPKVLVQTYKTLTSTGYAPKPMFLDCADTTVPHYGLNAVIDCLGLNPADTTGFRFRTEYKFHLSFKGVR